VGRFFFILTWDGVIAEHWGISLLLRLFKMISTAQFRLCFVRLPIPVEVRFEHLREESVDEDLAVALMKLESKHAEVVEGFVKKFVDFRTDLQWVKNLEKRFIHVHFQAALSVYTMSHADFACRHGLLHYEWRRKCSVWTRQNCVPIVAAELLREPSSYCRGVTGRPA
jgi:hypothetical protein